MNLDRVLFFSWLITIGVGIALIAGSFYQGRGLLNRPALVLLAVSLAVALLRLSLAFRSRSSTTPMETVFPAVVSLMLCGVTLWLVWVVAAIYGWPV